MPGSRSTPFEEPSTTKLVTVRVFGHVLLALIILALPVLGESRFLLSGFILIIAAPCVCWAGLRFKDPAHCWVDPLCDLALIIVAVWFMPLLWTEALCLGLMVALSPSVSLHPRSNVIYACYGALLLAGFGLALLIHEGQQDAVIPEAWLLVGILAIYPTLLVYANWQRRRAITLMERSNLLTAVNDVSGGVAHDFNNVLMAISGHAELARLQLPEDHAAQGSLREVVDGTSRASLLCGQLLAFTGTEKRERTVLDLTAEIQTIVGLLRPALPPGVSIEVSPFSAHLNIHGDRSEIQQVLLNIIVNAGEAMSETGGAINVSIARATHRPTNEAVITILDQGAGMPKEILRRIFDPFYTTKDRGHGLGLASVKRIMNSHDGEIEIDSEPGAGTRVTLRWPEHGGSRVSRGRLSDTEQSESMPRPELNSTAY